MPRYARHLAQLYDPELIAEALTALGVFPLPLPLPPLRTTTTALLRRGCRFCCGQGCLHCDTLGESAKHASVSMC